MASTASTPVVDEEYVTPDQHNNTNNSITDESNDSDRPRASVRLNFDTDSPDSGVTEDPAIAPGDDSVVLEVEGPDDCCVDPEEVNMEEVEVDAKDEGDDGDSAVSSEVEELTSTAE